MSIRNFYVEAEIDGRSTPLSGGPARKDGGMIVRFHQRSNGSTTFNALKVLCLSYDDKLVLRVVDRNGKVLHEYETER